MEYFNISVESAVSLYDDLMDKGDPRTEDWLFISTPLPAITMMLTYILVSLIGPHVMKDRKPLNLGHLLTAYNFLLVGMSSYMTYEFFMSAYLAGYSVGCQNVDYSNSPLALRMASVCWVYYISKYIETADTVFFILRKKFNQITFLHVFHHSTMIVNWWLCVKYIAGGPTFFHALINSFVHVVMYSYYGLSALGPAVQPYLWWKKYVTVIQVVQFTAVVIHSVHFVFRCDFPLGLSLLSLLYAVIMISLFLNYYHKEHVVRAKARQLRKQKLEQELQQGTQAKGITRQDGNGHSVTSSDRIATNGNLHGSNEVTRRKVRDES
ncbi:elongation of very long chain fatty acids protein 7 [Aplysia californica]|uniref:Elongation of very long chain fatty acids protein n=1 Tax=Aplysia californica TaxID=6500 RepID=A0ABM1A761_APLCA|nr:elongation of very long chain fatty acids protein 7 [Aplysia californica]